jgi:hypothetical protein
MPRISASSSGLPDEAAGLEASVTETSLSRPLRRIFSPDGRADYMTGDCPGQCRWFAAYFEFLVIDS